MKLSDLREGDYAIIQKLSNNKEVNTRLYSFGVAKGSRLEVEAISLGKQNISIIVDDTIIGLRTIEAASIEVIKQ